MKLSPRAGGPQGSAAAAGSWRGLPWCGSGGGHCPPGPAAVGPPAPSAALWGAGQQQAPLAQAHRISETTVKPFRGTTEVLMHTRFYA